ncbi:hypothetical protein Tco_0383563 [Tanacetum coccineum]
MADLAFVNQHNMVAYLEKSDENAEFHQIVDFLSTCSINYALTVSPTIYASYIEQFWNTATSKTVNSVKQIHAIVDGKAVVITESSVRNDLLFDDEDGITCLTNDEIFENLALMGYEQLSTKLTFQKGSFSPQWKFLIHTILHCISSKSTGWNEFSTEHTPLFLSMLAIQAEEGEGSGHPFEPQPPPSTAQLIHEEQNPNVVSSSHQKTQTPRQALNQVTELPQSSEPIPNVADEAVYEEWDNRVERATTTVASLDVAQASDMVLALETDLTQTKKVYGVAYTKLILKVKKLEKTVKSNQARRRAKIVVLDDEEDSSKQGRMIEEIDQDAGVTLVTPTHSQEDQPKDPLGVFSAAKVLADAAKNVHIYTRGRRAVSTGSGRVTTASRLFSTVEESVSTAGASMPVSTAGMVQEVNKDKCKGIMTESEPEQTKTKLTYQPERRNKPLIRAQQRTYMSNYIKYMGSHSLQQLKRLSFYELKVLFETTIRRVQTFHPIKSEGDKTVPKLTAGSSKRDAEVELGHKGFKKQKTNEASGSVQEQPEEEETELPQEDL